MIGSNFMKNCPVDRVLANNAVSIWAPRAANLKGKTTLSNTNPGVINDETIHPVPTVIMKLHSKVTICMDIMKVIGVPLLITISAVLHFAALFELKDLRIDATVKAIAKMVNIYKTRDFEIVGIVADNGFKALETNEEFTALKIPLNITSEDKHELFSERLIRSIKERIRMTFSNAPFKKIPRRMTIELVKCQEFWFKFTIPDNYISKPLSPGTIVQGTSYDYNKLCGPGTNTGSMYKLTRRPTTQ